MTAPALAARVFERIAAAWLSRAEHLAIVAETGYSFEEWANWEACFACHAEPSWRVKPRPGYGELGVSGSSLLGDVLIESADGRVLVEVGTVHDWTQSKWRQKLLADTEKARNLEGTEVVVLQVILRLRSRRFSDDRPRWLASVPCWSSCGLEPRRAPLSDGGVAEVRASIWIPLHARPADAGRSVPA